MNKGTLLIASSLLAAPAFAQADECVNATDLGTGNAALAFDTNMCSDTGVAATTSAEQQCFSLSNDVWVKYTASMTGLATFDTCNNATFDTEIGVWEGADCATMSPLGCNDDNGGAGCAGLTSLITVPVTAGETYHVQVGYWSSSGSTWGTGTITITEAMDPCIAFGDDSFEDNDDCPSAVPMADGNTTGLIISGSDNDFFEVGVADGATLQVDALFLDAEMDIDLYLWDPNVSCDTAIVGEGSGGGPLALGFSASDNETVSYTNATGACQNLIIEVTRWDGDSTGIGCANYDLVITGSAGVNCGGGIGSNYCMANPNSTGGTGVMSATGSNVVANNDVTLEATGLPNNATTFFIASETQGFVPNPAGSAGNLCLGGSIGRYVGPGQIQNTGGTGSAMLTIDLTNMPQPMGSDAVMAGDTWNFQAWHRDSDGMGGATSNFTDGYAIMFI